MTAPIPYGFILLSRKLLGGEIMHTPPLYWKLFAWMMLEASHQKHGNLDRGQLFTSTKKIQDAFSWRSGFRTVKPSADEIRAAYRFLIRQGMIQVKKAIHGMVITIENYDFYQNIQNYADNHGNHYGDHYGDRIHDDPNHSDFQDQSAAQSDTETTTETTTDATIKTKNGTKNSQVLTGVRQR